MRHSKIGCGDLLVLIIGLSFVTVAFSFLFGLLFSGMWYLLTGETISIYIGMLSLLLCKLPDVFLSKPR